MEKKLLVGWVFERALQDNWPFGLLLSDGTKMAISHIDLVNEDSQGNVWIDAQLSEHKKDGYFTDPTSRKVITINASKIIAIWELSDA